MRIFCTLSPKWDVRKLRDAPPIARSVQKNMLLSFRLCLKLRVSGNICWALVFGQCTANIFLKKYWLHLKLHLGFFHLIVVPHTVRDKIKVEKYRGYQPWLGDDPHLWSFRTLLWDLWGLALDQQNERNKTKAEEQEFFSEMMAYREKADTKEPYCL